MDELKAALELIKQTCNKHFGGRGGCAGCPLCLDNGKRCVPRYSLPWTWDIDEWGRQLETDGDSP